MEQMQHEEKQNLLEVPKKMIPNSVATPERQVWYDSLAPDKKDIQGLIARGYNTLNSAAYIMLRINNTGDARLYFKRLLDYITPADNLVRGNLTGGSKDLKSAVHIAFTCTGLLRLGLSKDTVATFSREFVEGMVTKDRSTMLGDERENNPDNWIWGNGTNEVDCMLMLYAENDSHLAVLKKEIYTDVQKGVTLAYMGGTIEYKDPISKEHFGFDDGISQPIMKGFRQSLHQSDDKLINTGEFILGHKNEYDDYSPSPYVAANNLSNELDMLPGFTDKKDLGKNGTYLVFRQMEQHVLRFWKYMYESSKEDPLNKTEAAVKLAAKMVGRWPNGKPLTLCQDDNCSITQNEMNDFNYFDNDSQGFKCPLGSHIRRTNPRDQVHTGRGQLDSVEMVRRHRMLRRARIYGEPVSKSYDVYEMIRAATNQIMNEAADNETKKSEAKVKRGLHFICLVSDIERQFEFVQNVWANTSTFADLCNEVDPLISPRPTDHQPDCHEFTAQHDPLRNRYKDLPEFTTVIGGAYFFMPGLKALKYILY